MQKTFAITLFLALTFVFVGTVVLAETIEIKNPLQAKTFTDIINNILNFLFGFAIVLAPILVAFAGFTLLTAGGNPAQLTKAKGILLWTVVGFGVILLARGLTTVLRKIIGF